MFRFESSQIKVGGRWAMSMLVLLFCGSTLAQSKFPGIGRPATPAEVKAWDIDVRADFVGLPKGSGSVEFGQKVWDEKCASCHGTFGESNEVFTPIVGGTTAADIKSGRVRALISGDYPQRTTLMKLSSIASMWDYINRAMPWNAPKSLSVEEVYGVTAYILHMGDILPANFVMSDANIREVQNRLPNRNGMTRAHGMWDVKGQPDIRNVACMKDCEKSVAISSALPDYARNAHGNLSEQNRLIGAVRGVNTSAPGAAAKAQVAANPAKALADKHACMACHGVANKIVGPGFKEVQSKYQGKLDADALGKKIQAGGSGVWGSIPMPAQAGLSADDARILAKWILEGAS